MLILSNYIGGEFKSPAAGGYIDNVNPSTGEVYSKVPDSGYQDVNDAVLAAEAAYYNWGHTDITTRSKIMLAIAEQITKNLEELAIAECTDSGKTITLAKSLDIPRASSNFEYFGTAIQQFSSEAHVNAEKSLNYTIRAPLGVVGCISPWNLPLYLFTWKIAPAIAAGNCVVAKPSEVTPVTAWMLADICKKAGLPAGVLNIIHGTGPNCGAEIVKHPRIKAISFTGSTRAGKEIASVASPMFKKLSLELGGKNPVLIFADCDYDKMIDTTIRSAFTNQGQICLCGSRVYVERSIYERFKKDFVEKVKKMKVGDPLSPDTNLGAIVSEQHFNKVMGYIQLAQEEGGNILCGGKSIKMDGALSGGHFIEPTVIEGLSNTSRCNQEEIFGPVVSIQPFSDEDEALSLANQNDYGLAAVIWTRDLNRAHRVAEHIESGIVWINCWLVRDLRTPFGGVKNSGVGREGGWEALRFFTETKNICIQF